MALLRLESGDRQKASRTTIGPWPHECGQGRHLNLHVSRDVDIYIYMQAWICWLQSRQHSIACTLLGREKKKKKKGKRQRETSPLLFSSLCSTTAGCVKHEERRHTTARRGGISSNRRLSSSFARQHIHTNLSWKLDKCPGERGGACMDTQRPTAGHGVPGPYRKTSW